MNLLSVGPTVCDRHSGRGRELADVVVERLPRVPDRQGVLDEPLGRPTTDAQQFRHAEPFEHRVVHPVHVVHDHPRIGLTHLGNGLAGRVMNERHLVDAVVGRTATKDGNVKHKSHLT